MIDLKSFLTKDKFSEEIEKKVLNDGLTYFEAVLDFAEDCDKSPEELVRFMSPVIIDKLKKSAYESGMMDNKDSDLDVFLED